MTAVKDMSGEDVDVETIGPNVRLNEHILTVDEARRLTEALLEAARLAQLHAVAEPHK